MKTNRIPFAWVLGLTAAVSVGAENERPNIVLIMADDMGYSDIGCYGGEIQTANIDALAANGLRFTQFYNTARCCPTRAALLTGLHQHQTGIGQMTESPQGPRNDHRPAYQGFLNRSCVTMAEVLGAAGYHTYMAGKWHLGYHGREKWPRARGFDRFYGSIAGATSYFKPQGGRGVTLDNENLEPPTDPHYYTTDAFTDYALRFMQEQKDDAPFFLYLAYTAPHWPLHARQEDIKKYAGTYRGVGWDELRKQRLARQKQLGIMDPSVTLPTRDEGVRPWDDLTDQQKDQLDYRMAVYAAMVDRMDQNIGRVVDLLKKEGKLDNTLILFLSDNGGCAEPYKDLGGGKFSDINNPNVSGAVSYGQGWANASNTPFRKFKVFSHEGGISTPLIVHWPAGLKTTPGSITHTPAQLIDLMPTILDVTGAKYPKEFAGHKIGPLEGVSLASTLLGRERKPAQWMFWEHAGHAAVRHGDFKALLPKGKREWELYDLSSDRQEQTNLAMKMPAQTKRMAQHWRAWAVRVGVSQGNKSESGSDRGLGATSSVRSTRLAKSSFWYPRLKTNHEVTVWHELEMCEITGRTDNFRIAAGEKDGLYRGLRFDDSDFYKVLEGASRILASSPDPKLEAELDKLIATVAKAQQPDGYIYTVMQVRHDPAQPVKGVVPGERWLHEQESHETYCMGHLIEAGIAHFEATGKRSLLGVAIRAADCLVNAFGPGKIELPPGHQEVEIALARLAKVTGNDDYLNLAQFFLEQRGRLSKDRERLWSAYFQDHVPVRAQQEAVGHAVRAAYLYMAMADVAMATDDVQYRSVLRILWENVAGKKLYLTGGIGGGSGEGFSAEYQLPNLRAYNETCSSIANILWQQRMFAFAADAKYIDIAERCMLNSFLSGVSLDGDAFFYPNALTSVSGHQRSPWFKCACCPPNVLRFLPQVPSLFYSTRQNTVMVNLYGSSQCEVSLESGDVRLVQASDYPWDGKIRIEVMPAESTEFTVAVRIPGWLSKPFPSDLYRYADGITGEATTRRLSINGQPYHGEPSAGYELVTRRWNRGDVIELDFPMPVRCVIANEHVAACRDRVAVMRGPIVYATEGHDNDGKVHSLAVPLGTTFKVRKREDLLGGVVTLQAEVKSVAHTEDGLETTDHELTAIPYYAWAHRGPSPMRVWLAATREAAWPTRADLRYSRAKVTVSGKNPWTSTSAVRDQILPPSSDDNETPRFLWDKTDSASVGPLEWEDMTDDTKPSGGVRWIQYSFDSPTRLSSSSIYWVTGNHGNWALPKQYRLFYQAGDQWRAIEAKLPPASADTLQTMGFEDVTTKAVRLEIVPAINRTAGIMEWIVQ